MVDSPGSRAVGIGVYWRVEFRDVDVAVDIGIHISEKPLFECKGLALNCWAARFKGLGFGVKGLTIWEDL
jgi:hypothetical protein